MGDTKVAAFMFLFFGAFLFWLHSQGKLIPLFQELFGLGAAGQQRAAVVTSAASQPAPATSSTLPANPSLIDILVNVAQTALKAPVPKAPVTTAPAQAAPAPGSPGVLPNFPGSQQR